jgi:hypothetical protein
LRRDQELKAESRKQKAEMKNIKRTSLILAGVATLFFPLAASAAQTKLFEGYESVRQALLARSIDDVQRTARELAVAARAEKQKAIAERASALASAADIDGARDSFAMLSDTLIRFRDGRFGPRPVVLYCSMEKKSWLQPKGPITNPYVDASMRSCGEVRRDLVPPASTQGHHH